MRLLAGSALALTLLAVPPARAAETTVDTVAGGLSGRMPATRLPLAAADVVVDPKGRLYVASDVPDRAMVFRVDPDGTAVRVAGNGTPRHVGDGGPATAAALRSAAALALDAAGNLYVADATDHRVRRITPAGTVSTVAGTGVAGGTGDGGPAAAAQLSGPAGLAFDAAGNLYVGERGGHRIRRIAPGGTISAYAGSGTDGLSPDGTPANVALLGEPVGLAFDRDGALLFAEPADGLVRKIGTDGRLATVAGYASNAGRVVAIAAPDRSTTGDGGPALLAAFERPSDVAVSASGTVYVADTDSLGSRPSLARLRVRQVAGSTVSTLAGTGALGYQGEGGPAAAANLAAARGVAVAPNGDVYVADGPRLLKVAAATGVVTTVAGAADHFGDARPATGVVVSRPGLVAPVGDAVYFAELGSVVRRLRGGVVETVGGTGTKDPAAGVPAAEARFPGLHALGAGPAGELLVGMTQAIWAVTPAGVLAPFAAGAAFTGITDLATDPAGNVYVAEVARVIRVARDGTVTTVAGTGVAAGELGDGGPATKAVVRPTSLAVAPDGTLYLGETDTHRVRRIDPAGTITTMAGGGDAGFSGDDGPAAAAKLAQPVGVAVDAAGQVYVADTANHRIRRIASGTITTVAGTGDPGFSGDGGAAAGAAFYRPDDIAALPDGTVLVAESANDRIRALAPPVRTATALSASPAKIRRGAQVQLAGTLTVAGRPLAGVLVDVRRNGAVLARVRTDAAGRFRVTDRPPSDRTYVASYAGSLHLFGSSSKPVVVRVR